MMRRDAYPPESAPALPGFRWWAGANATQGRVCEAHSLAGRDFCFMHAHLGMPARTGNLAGGVAWAALHIVGAKAVMWMGWASGQHHPWRGVQEAGLGQGEPGCDALMVKLTPPVGRDSALGKVTGFCGENPGVDWGGNKTLAAG